MSAEISMDAIVSELVARGHVAYVEQTGGGVATIYAGDSYRDSKGDKRVPALAGPGTFHGPHWTLAFGDIGDFYIGLDNDGATDPAFVVTAPLSPADIADLIITVIDGQPQGHA